jgi:hypothetical protein
MLVFPLCLGISALVTATAVPIPANLPSSSRIPAPDAPPYPTPANTHSVLAAPYVDFKSNGVRETEQPATRQQILREIETKPEFAAATCVSVESRWRRLPDGKQQQLFCTLQTGVPPNTLQLGHIRILRPCPDLKSGENPLKPKFSPNVAKAHRKELEKQIKGDCAKLDPQSVSAIRGITVANGWHLALGDRPLHQTQVCYHAGKGVTTERTIYRPLTLEIGSGVPQKDVKIIEKRVRTDHAKIGDDYKPHLKTSNYGHVDAGWRDIYQPPSGGNYIQPSLPQEVVVKYSHLPANDRRYAEALGADCVRLRNVSQGV